MVVRWLYGRCGAGIDADEFAQQAIFRLYNEEGGGNFRDEKALLYLSLQHRAAPDRQRRTREATSGGTVQLFVQSKPGYDSMDHVVPTFTSFYSKCSAQRSGFIGDAFSYVAASAGNAYGFLLLLYEYFWWFVIAVPPDYPMPRERD